MTEGIQDYKRLEGMLKESEQKREKDLAMVKGRVDAALEETKSLINGMTVQHNEIKNQLNNQEGVSIEDPSLAIFWAF